MKNTGTSIVLLSVLLSHDYSYAEAEKWPPPSDAYVLRQVPSDGRHPSVRLYLPQSTQFDTQVVSEGGISYRALIFTIGSSMFQVGFDMGPSEDPTYRVAVRRGDTTVRSEIIADAMAITDEYHIYSYTRSDMHYGVRQKFVVANDGIHEQKQPYYLVDAECDVTDRLDIYTEKCGQGELVASMPPGARVRVMLTDSHDVYGACPGNRFNFLVSTPLGLVGWVQTTSGTQQPTGRPLSCIYIMGD